MQIEEAAEPPRWARAKTKNGGSSHHREIYGRYLTNIRWRFILTAGPDASGGNQFTKQ
jgi:hypothetical protein